MNLCKSLAQIRGWEYRKPYVYGKIDNYLITVRQVIDYLNTANNCKLVFIPLTTITQEQADNLMQFLNDNKKELKVRAFDLDRGVLVLRLHETFKGYTLEQFDKLIETLVKFLKDYEISTVPTCLYCNNGDVNAIMKVDKIAFHAHEECIAKAQCDLENTKNEYKKQKKNYVSGMIGAFIGAIIGAIPWMLLELFWGFAAVLSLLIGYAAYYGYQKLGGLTTKTTKWLILIPCLFAVVVSNLFAITNYLLSEEIELSFSEYVKVYTDSEISRDILANLGIGILFFLLGYISIFRKIKADEFDREIE